MTPESETNGLTRPGRPFPWHCPRCRRPEVRPATIPYHAERLYEGRLVTVDVPELLVAKCANCGEVLLDRAAEEQLIKATAARAKATDPNPAAAGGGNGVYPITPYHAACYAHELTRRSASDSIAKIGSSMINATVDLNPHQLDAALFAFAAPLSRGAILADEVGLGKTIEAALVISQLWAEHKRRVLVIAPATIRKQWQQELQEKFFLDAAVIDSREFRAAEKVGERPLEPAGRVVIVSHHFAAARSAAVAAVPWDLVVIDEAHRLRNVWKPGAKIANAIRCAVRGRPLLLLTATPLQNDLLELYGLVSFLDEHVFGDIEAFRARYKRNAPEGPQLNDLRERLRGVCKRTLRRQVTEYVPFTERIPITQDFTPTPAEQELYDLVSTYLQRETLFALPAAQRKLMTLVLRKLLASSSHAIAGTLRGLAERLRARLATAAPVSAVAALAPQKDLVMVGAADEGVLADYDTAEELVEEWESEPPNHEQVRCFIGPVEDFVEEVELDPAAMGPAPGAPEGQDQAILAELRDLEQYGRLAASITDNAKGRALLTALKQGFAKLQELRARRKAVVFTESRRTQEYLYGLLQDDYAGRVLTINGSNADERSAAIYRAWLQRHESDDAATGNKAVDLRAALVEHFRDHADILVATEAAAEGLNLQFCSLVVNYDLPWNPQRIEQRIGRCHRYGQKHDVVVINFLNRGNAADERVFELLSEKFRLFEGVFGSSDEVLGALESGVDFERRVAEIYLVCRSREEIDAAFGRLRTELEEQITARMADTREQLLEHFDEEVHQRLKMTEEQRNNYLERAERWLWNLTRHELEGYVTFLPHGYAFRLHALGPGWPDVPQGTYSFVTKTRRADGEHAYRFGHPLAQAVLDRARERPLRTAHVRFDYSGHAGKVDAVEGLVGRSGWLRVAKLHVESVEEEDRLLFAAVPDQGPALAPEVYGKLFDIGGEVVARAEVPAEDELRLLAQVSHLEDRALKEVADRNREFFEREIDKLNRWADDRKAGLEFQLKNLDAEIKQADREAQLAPTLEEKLALQKKKKDLEGQRKEKRRHLFDAEDEIEARKGELIAEVERRLQSTASTATLFTIRWDVV